MISHPTWGHESAHTAWEYKHYIRTRNTHPFTLTTISRILDSLDEGEFLPVLYIHHERRMGRKSCYWLQETDSESHKERFRPQWYVEYKVLVLGGKFWPLCCIVQLYVSFIISKCGRMPYSMYSRPEGQALSWVLIRRRPVVRTRLTRVRGFLLSFMTLLTPSDRNRPSKDCQARSRERSCPAAQSCTLCRSCALTSPS